MQVHHFQQRIEGNPEWVLVKIYKDEGRSGTTIHGRQGFQDMIADAVDGKIDLILTKSINRFGRNIVDTLRRTQRQKAKEESQMKTKNARRIIRILFPASRHYNATIVYSSIVCQISIEAPDEFRARVELDRIADGGYITFFEEA